jgi:acetylornithine deacetylase/succinyl-diaminopimelate desuccinylase-like protein
MPEDDIAGMTAGGRRANQSNRLQQRAAKLMGYRRVMTRIALLGDRDLRFVTHRALEAAVARLPDGVAAEWVGTDTPAARSLDGFDGVWVLPGTPYRDDDAVLAAIDRVVESGTPLLGTCGGFQYAVLVLARDLAGLAAVHAETDPATGTTLNVGVIEGGTRANVVAAHAGADVDVRVTTMAEAERLDAFFRGLRPRHPEAVLEVTGGLNRPPMERTPRVAELFAYAQRTGAGLGLQLDEAGVGGGSDGNFCAAVNPAVLDGLGAVGDGAHAASEHVVVAELAPRTALLAHLLTGLARG